MKIYVINLPLSRKRRRKMQQRLDSFNLRYEIVEAISSNEIDSNKINEINRKAPRGGDMKLAEVACVHSHSKALRKLVDDNEDVGIILEDDVVFHRKFAELACNISSKDLSEGPFLFYALFFSPTKIYRSDSITERFHHYTVESVENIWGAMAYAVKREDAENLAARMLDTCCRADDWYYYVNNHVVKNVTVCFPFVVKHEELNSDIAKFDRLSGLFSISGISKFIHRYRVFPFFQISIFIRQRRAEKRQARNIILRDIPYSKTYVLK